MNDYSVRYRSNALKIAPKRRNCFVQSRDCVTFLPYVFPKQWDWLLSLCSTCFPLPSVCAICSYSLLATQGGSLRLFLRIWFLFHRCQLSFPFHEVVWWRKQCNIWLTCHKLWGFWFHCVFTLSGRWILQCVCVLNGGYRFFGVCFSLNPVFLTHKTCSQNLCFSYLVFLTVTPWCIPSDLLKAWRFLN